MVDSAAILNARILIVDDLPANVRLLELILRGHGYACVATTMDPSQVCGLHRDHRYDLILLDLQMPGLDGFGVMEELKTIEQDGYLPVLVITAQPDKKLRVMKEALLGLLNGALVGVVAAISMYSVAEVKHMPNAEAC